jgi:hypothetical protein
MKLQVYQKAFVLILMLAFGRVCFSQGFVNLDFESAKVIPVVGDSNYPNAVAITNAVPGWSVFGTMNGNMLCNLPSIGTTSVILLATNGVITGNYSVQLEGGFSFFPATISQTGLVPFSAQSILFAAQQGGTGLLNVSLGGQDLPLSVVSTGMNYTLYGADVSAFAGQRQELMFSASSTGINNWTIDNIQFSATPIPEPGVFGLFALGGTLLGLRRWKK